MISPEESSTASSETASGSESKAPTNLVHRSTSVDASLAENVGNISIDEDREVQLDDLHEHELQRLVSWKTKGEEDKEEAKNGNSADNGTQTGAPSTPHRYNTRSNNANNGNGAASSSVKSSGDDESDAFGFGKSAPTARNVARMPVSKDSEVYNMTHPRRGIAFVFNHMHFDPRLGLKQRNGTHADRDNLRNTLLNLSFDVRVYNDLSFKDIDRLLEDAAADDHADADCIFVAVLSHGEQGILYSSDAPYKPDRIWSHFSGEKCPSLAGKPKLFFVQACQGDQLDNGMKLSKVSHTETDAGAHSYKIPSHADFLIAYSTIPGFYSWRNTTAGSWFVQALCHVLAREADSRDLLSILTRVSRRVALDFQSNTPGDSYMHEKKQIPCITSMLTRDVYFVGKPTAAWERKV